MKHIWLIVQIKLLSDKKQMSVQHKKNFTKLDNQDHILAKKGLAAVAGRFLETKKVRLRDGKVFFLFIRILFFSKNATYFVIDPVNLITWFSVVNYYCKELHLRCCKASRSTSVHASYHNKIYCHRYGLVATSSENWKLIAKLSQSTFCIIPCRWARKNDWNWHWTGVKK